MKKYLLLFGLIAMTACSSSRDDKSCNCYEQKFQRVQRINPQGQTVNDTGWQSVGSKKEYSKNCDDNNKVFDKKDKGEQDISLWTTRTYSETRIECN